MKLFGSSRLAGVLLAAAITGAPLGAASSAFAQDAAAPAAEAPAVALEPAVEAAPAPVVEAAPPAPAVEEPWSPDTGDTAWVLTATALVLMMTIPGLALFYGGMVRKKNVISTVTQSFAVTALVTILWIAVGYSATFYPNASAALQPYIGDFSNLFLGSIKMDSHNALAATVPEYVFIMFQLTFAIITPALICGAFAERIKFSGMLLFMALWLLFVYVPVAHMVWGGGLLGSKGVLDFAGGAVVHINAGVAGLVCAIFIGKRKGYGIDNMAPHNLVLTMVGASLLWVGWFGFNAGSAVGANGLAGIAMLNTQVAAAAAALAWMSVEWIERRKPGMLGLASGAVAGLVAVTPAAGFVNPMGALVIGFISGVGCYFGAVWLKKLLRYDDSLDAFGVHGVGGIIGALLTGVFADASINSLGENASLATQAFGVVVTVAYTATATFIILVIVKFTTGLRVSEDAEVEGLDASQHGEALHE